MAASLLLPSTDAACRDEALERLLQGRAAEDFPVPESWKFFQEAVRGNIQAAIGYLREPTAQASFDEDLRRYNLFVLDPNERDFEQLQLELDGELRHMLDVAAYHAGVIQQIPAAMECSSLELSGELRAWGLVHIAAAEIERESFVLARQTLGIAIDLVQEKSPLLAAMFMAQSAQIAQHCLELPASLVRSDYERAIEIAKDAALPGFLAELWTQLGMLLQSSAQGNREQWLAAVRAYQAALQSGVSPADQPILFAELHNNLGLAYLAMPAGETSYQLRVGIAIQSFRHAVEALDPSRHSDLCARIKMNLANALQYAPSSHPESNLIQAVNLYDEILEVRTRLVNRSPTPWCS